MCNWKFTSASILARNPILANSAVPLLHKVATWKITSSPTLAKNPILANFAIRVLHKVAIWKFTSAFTLTRNPILANAAVRFTESTNLKNHERIHTAPCDSDENRYTYRSLHAEQKSQWLQSRRTHRLTYRGHQRSIGQIYLFHQKLFWPL